MNNTWSGRKSTGVLTPKIWLPDQPMAAVLQMTVVDPAIGPEVVLALKDSHPKARAWFRSKGLWLRLRAGLWETAHGAIIYMAWLLPKSRYGRCPAMYGDLANPCDPACVPLLEIAGEQTHLHVFLYAARNQFVRAIEVPNVYRLGELAEAARQASEETPVTDFDAAQDDFDEEFDLSRIVDTQAA